MKCFNHIDMDATATCNNCSKGLCSKCSSRFSLMLCESCLLEHNKSIAIEMYIGLAITTIILIGSAVFMIMQTNTGEDVNILNALLVGLLFSFTYWGWKFLSTYFPSLTVATGNVWIIYICIKFTIAYFIGLLVGPYQIYKMLRDIKIAKKIKNQIEKGEI